MQRVVLEQSLGFVATVTPDGRPNLSPKGTTTVFDAQHLMFADVASPGTIANLATNPNVEVNVVDPIVRKGYRFKGIGTVHTSGATYERGLAILRERVVLAHGRTDPFHRRDRGDRRRSRRVPCIRHGRDRTVCDRTLVGAPCGVAHRRPRSIGSPPMGGLEVVDPRYQALYDDAVAVLGGDGRVAGVEVVGSVGAGTADAWSDLDLCVVTHDDGYASFLDEWPAWLAAITPTVFARTPIAPFVINTVTAEGLTFDVSVYANCAPEFSTRPRRMPWGCSRAGVSPTSAPRWSTPSPSCCAASPVRSSVSSNGTSMSAISPASPTCSGCSRPSSSPKRRHRRRESTGTSRSRWSSERR